MNFLFGLPLYIYIYVYIYDYICIYIDFLCTKTPANQNVDKHLKE